MRFLVVGAGAIGGYFGGRMLQAGRDVTFLVRPRRAALLAEHGLVIKSKLGDAAITNPPTVLAEALTTPFDVIVLSCKGYDLENAVASFAPAVGSDTVIIPFLNGMRHLDVLQDRFGKDRVLGGQCVVATTLDDKGAIIHLNDTHIFSVGETAGGISPRMEALSAEMVDVPFTWNASDNILQEMWEKWVFIVTSAGITSLMRATVGDIVSAGASDLSLGLLDECAAVAESNGFKPRPAFMELQRTVFTAAGSPMNASMSRDIEKNAPIEADHVVGDMLRRRRGATVGPSILGIVYAHLKTYEARRSRESAAR
jgi:2-dehydropantoate 2-reductase